MYYLQAGFKSDINSHMNKYLYAILFMQEEQLSLNYEKFLYFLHTNPYIYTSITQYLSVADNARDAVFLHVSASSEKQERRNETEIKKRTKHEILKHHDVYVSLCIVVLFHSVSGYTFTFTSYFMSDYHIKTKTKQLSQIIL
jgi:hypothetical protein